MSVPSNIDADKSVTEHAFRGTSPSSAVVRAVAERAGLDAGDLRPLGSVLDADALDEFIGNADDPADDHTRLDFTYAGYRVTVRSDGIVRLAADPID